MLFSAVNQAVEKSAGGNDNGARQYGAAIPQAYAPRRSRRTLFSWLLKQQIHHFRLLDVQVCLRLEHLAHLHPVLALVALRSRRPHRRPAGGIQQAELDADRVGDLAHNPTQRIHFAHQVPFGDASNGGIA